MAYKVKGTCVDVSFVVLGAIENNVYFVTDGASAIVVDPSCKPDVIMEALDGRKLDAIVLTHRHFDHVGAAAELRRRTGAKRRRVPSTPTPSRAKSPCRAWSVRSSRARSTIA